MNMPRVDRTLEIMSWTTECVKVQVEIEWRKARKAGIEFSKTCKCDIPNEPIWYSDGYLPPMPPPRPQSTLRIQRGKIWMFENDAQNACSNY